jgi:AcrR family transcriptional regulator
MTTTSQGALRTSIPEGGRVNQKRRTHAAIVAAAQRLVDRGITPTVAQAAEEALVSRTTAYRYFPTQESLLVELAVLMDLPDFEVTDSVPDDDVRTRVRAMVDGFNSHVLEREEVFRRALRVYLDIWLATHEVDDAPLVRAGRRLTWIRTILEPVAGDLEPDARERLEAALCLVLGAEPLVVLRDVCRLSTEDAVAVTRWVADAILAAALLVRDGSLASSLPSTAEESGR